MKVSKNLNKGQESFEASKCHKTEETPHFIIFRGAFEGQKGCNIIHWIEIENNYLYDVYSATVGYDDLTGEIGKTGHKAIYRKGAHYQFECKVKRTKQVTTEKK